MKKLCLVLGVLLALACLVAAQRPATAQSPAPQGALAQRGTGQPLCGLGKEFHAGRRAALRAKLGGGVLVLRGLPTTRDYAEFYQDKVFWYLTGVESPNAALLMDLDSGRELLYLPKQSKGAELWEGELWDAGDEWVPELTGFKEVHAETQLLDDLAGMLGQAQPRVLWTSLSPHLGLSGGADRARPFDQRQTADALDARVSREQALAQALEQRFALRAQDISKELNELRRVKTFEEIGALRRACDAAAVAMVEAQRSARADMGEWEIDALMDFLHQREGATGPGYMAIVGSGPNSCILHYSASSRRMRAGEVLLVDYAPEYEHYVCDLTRTWPVDGKFTPRMAELYDAVLAAQQAGIDQVRPGKQLRDVELAAASVLRERGFGDLIRHGTCHYVGLEVHDQGANDAPFVPGVAFTVEPGLYDSQAAIGIRIEDVVLVTADGCEVLTRAAPRERAELERLVATAGLLDQLPAR